jgi:hypothetical protein
VAAGASLCYSVNGSTWERESCLQRSTVKLQQVIGPGAARLVTGAFERLERPDGKVSRAVLKGAGGQQCPLATRPRYRAANRRLRGQRRRFLAKALTLEPRGG